MEGVGVRANVKPARQDVWCEEALSPVSETCAGGMAFRTNPAFLCFFLNGVSFKLCFSMCYTLWMKQSWGPVSAAGNT